MDSSVPQQVKTCAMGGAAPFLLSYRSLRRRQHISCYEKISSIPLLFYWVMS